ncbi:discoidin domain-containing receptor 2 [Folsomia candida]|uniref:discoidin domain-containing receptor 2 n=1 Tax=Folsomia candida TaxID=158441 RepID=UPI001604B5AB|nr:discoidin domain-containing receptor 2 [Folsomia candida]
MDGWIFQFLSTLLFSWVLLPSHIYGIGDTHLCSTPLSKDIPDAALSASSYYVNLVGPHQARLNNEEAGGAWCPKEPISAGARKREWLQISLNETHLISGVQIQGRHGKGTGQEFTEEFEVEYWREGFQAWRKYYRFDSKKIFPGNSDTVTAVTAKLRPPLIAKMIRILPYSKGVRTVCIRIELLGCPWKGGLIQYTVEQGSTFSEGISLRDDSYDGQGGSKWDKSVESSSQLGDYNEQHAGSQNSFQIVHQPDSPNLGLYFDGESSGPVMLTGGLGQLSDTIEGANSFTMDIGYGLGNGWVGWRKPEEGKDWLEVQFEFEQVRKFSSLDLFSNNFPSKGVQIFARAKVYFSVGGVYFNGKPVTYVPNVDVAADFARNFTIPLDRVARFIKVHLYYRTSWIVLGEVYFHSEIYEGNYTQELGPDVQLDFPDTHSMEIGDLDSSMVETVVGIITGLILLVGIVSGVIVWMRRSGRNISSAFHFQGAGAFPWRANWSSHIPTHIVAQTNPTTEGVKDLILTLTPGNGGGTVVVNGDFKAHNLPSYTNGTVSKHSNGLQLQGTQFNNYGSTKRLADSGRKTVADSGTNNGIVSHNHGSPTKVTLRTNQLAALDENADYGEGENENIYHEACTLTISSATKSRNKKIKVASSVWNLSSGGRSYRPGRGRVPDVSLRQLRLIENLGSCLHGQVHLYDFEGEIACHEGTMYRNCRLIGKTIKNLAEIRLLSLLDHEHILETVALCSEMKKPLLCLFIAPECGDLCSFLSRLTNTPSLSWLLSAASQIASGMNYLESMNITFADLSARNCMVEREGSIRIADLAMACEQYQDDYCPTPNGLAPLRWWSWESILSEDFTMQGSVWSFGVTLWEILTLCRQKPLAHIPDHQITTLAEKYGSTATSQQVWLPQPLLSPPEIFDLMRECWQVNPAQRPTFQHLSLFLEQKCSTSIYHAVC